MHRSTSVARDVSATAPAHGQMASPQDRNATIFPTLKDFLESAIDD